MAAAPLLAASACLGACTGGTAGSLPDAGPPPLPPELIIDGPEQLAVGGQAVFRVLARRKGKPVASEPVRVRTEERTEVFAGVTGPDGACDVRFDVAKVAQEGDEEVHLVFQVGTSPSRSRTSRSLAVRSSWRPMLELDHERVRPGGSVRARVTVFHPDRLVGVEGVATRIEFLAPGGIPVARAEGATDDSGQFLASVDLQELTPWGAWVVRAKAGETITEEFTVLPPISGEAPAKPEAAPRRIPPPKEFRLRLRPASGLLAGGLDNPLVALVTFAGVPAPGAEVVVRHAGVKASGRTGERGEAWMSLPIPEGGSPVRVSARVSNEAGHRLEREFVLPRHPGGGGLVVRPAFAVSPPGKPIRVRVDGPPEGQVVVDAWRRGRLVATLSSALVAGKASVDADPEVLGPGLVWFVARPTGRGARASWGAAPTFVPPLGVLDIRVRPGAKSYSPGDEAKLQVTVEDDMAKPTAAHVSGWMREAGPSRDPTGQGALRSISHRLANRLLDGLPDRAHPAGDLYELVARCLTGPVNDGGQAVARMHLAGLRFSDAPGPWPLLPPSVSGADDDPEGGTPAIPWPDARPPQPDVAGAFPAGLRVEGEAGAELPLKTRDQGGVQTGALAAIADGRLGLRRAVLDVDQPFVLTVEAPADVTHGDVISLPATVHNLLDRKQAVDVRLQMADWFELSDVQTTKVRPGPDGAETARFQVTARKVGTHELRFVAKTEELRKEVVVRVTVHPDGMPYEVMQAGVFDKRKTRLSFTLPVVTKDVPERAHLTLDPTVDRLLGAALRISETVPRWDLISEAAVTRIAARVAARPPPEPGQAHEALPERAKALLAPQFQRLLRFRRTDGGWALWRGGAADDEAAETAAATLPLLVDAGITGAQEALASLPPAPPPERGAGGGRHPSLGSLLNSREGDGGWGSVLDTEQAIEALLDVEPLRTPPVEVFVEMDGEPLGKRMFDPTGPPMQFDLPDRIGPGPHLLQIVLPSEDAGLPWTLRVRTSVEWPKKPQPIAGWHVRLKGPKKTRRGGFGTLKLTLNRTEDAEPTPDTVAVRVALPPGALPVRADLDAAVQSRQIAGYELTAGAALLFLSTDGVDGRLDTLGASVRFLATVSGRFRTPPTTVWSLADPGIAGPVRGPKLSVK